MIRDDARTRSLRILARLILLALTSLAALVSPAQSASAATATWSLLPEQATDIGVGASGAVWKLGTNPVPGGYGVWQYVNGWWTPTDGGGVKISVGRDGQPWLVNS